MLFYPITMSGYTQCLLFFCHKIPAFFLPFSYRIYPAIRRGFWPSRMTSNKYTSPMKFSYNTKLTLPKSKDLDPSYKMDLGLWECFGRKKLCLITEEIRYFCVSEAPTFLLLFI